MAKVLIGCEESQAVCIEFRKLGHEAYSCDLLPSSGGYPEWHLQMDVFEAIEKIKPDLALFFPPCTFVAGSSVQWLSHPDDKHLPFINRREHPKYPGRRIQMLKSIEFFHNLFYHKDLKLVGMENPVGLLSSFLKKPTQIIQPYMFGDEATKTTCLWLKGLPNLVPTNVVGKGDRIKFSSGKSHPAWYAAARGLSKEERQKIRSKTFPGIAKAMAEQWGKLL